MNFMRFEKLSSYLPNYTFPNYTFPNYTVPNYTFPNYMVPNYTEYIPNFPAYMPNIPNIDQLNPAGKVYDFVDYIRSKMVVVTKNNPIETTFSDLLTRILQEDTFDDVDDEKFNGCNEFSEIPRS